MIVLLITVFNDDYHESSLFHALLLTVGDWWQWQWLLLLLMVLLLWVVVVFHHLDASRFSGNRRRLLRSRCTARGDACGDFPIMSWCGPFAEEHDQSETLQKDMITFWFFPTVSSLTHYNHDLSMRLCWNVRVLVSLSFAWHVRLASQPQCLMMHDAWPWWLKILFRWVD